MKTLVLIYLLIITFTIIPPSLAGSGYEQTTEKSFSWNSIWQEFKNDWQGIGNGMEESGVKIGQALKKESQEMPENFRKGYEAAKKDLQSITVSPGKKPTEN